ncbi:GNAT family N-acetyltransferase [Luteibacter rhizovicinus DSM 16549]|uniref:GNAT family N-acetyltransferase n=2 Tax=Luteibacter rhizovicinus TaxID=242606 RepID=A0A0G9HA90_9GAMM|nr:GNAT family N-acetyltransferase [Luteibacter rhizovicinus DSM 16549]KLD66695.1 GCN5 family acetyltransferase [Luteibacter rhizovicinus DSM 16549]KLD78745.1 GCN5 family acetyltransferase [Xanthomonas hyacinthi DSM 19077]
MIHPTEPTSFDLRVATIAQAAALADVMERTFRATFGDSTTDGHMAEHCRSSYGEALQRAEIGDPDTTTLLVKDGDVIAGFAQVRPGNRPNGVTASQPVEIHRIYVDVPWHGKGVAAMLMEAALRDAVKRGADGVWLGVWEDNARAIRFYAKWGFVAVGEHIFHVGGDAQRDVLMSRAL